MRVTTVPPLAGEDGSPRPHAIMGQPSPAEIDGARYAPRSWFLAAPLVLIVATLLVFQAAVMLGGGRAALLAGFPFYWTLGGVVLPLLLIGRDGYATLFTSGAVRWTMPLRLAVLALAAPAAFGFLFVFPLQFPTEGWLLLPGIALYAMVNGTLEEVFWRGTFARRFPANVWLGVLYPAVLFGLWQLVPWAMNPEWLRVPVVAVLGVSLFMGLLYNWVAWRMGSIRWTVLAHVLTNLSGIGALLVFGPSF